MDTILLKNICFLSDKAVKKEKKKKNIYIYIRGYMKLIFITSIKQHIY